VMGFEHKGNGRAVSVVWIMISLFLFPLLSQFMVGISNFLHIPDFFHLLRSLDKGITPNFYFRFLSHLPSPVLYIFMR
jgi:hypothetical protein